MTDHLGRWVSWATYLYPASGVARTVVTVGRVHVEVERPLAPLEVRLRGRR